SRRRHTRSDRDWSSDVCSSDLAFLYSLPAAQLDALKIGLDAYEKLPPSIRECAFETRFDDCDDDGLLDPKFLFKVWLNEAIHIRSEERRVGKECRHHGSRPPQK